MAEIVIPENLPSVGLLAEIPKVHPELFNLVIRFRSQIGKPANAEIVINETADIHVSVGSTGFSPLDSEKRIGLLPTGSKEGDRSAAVPDPDESVRRHRGSGISERRRNPEKKARCQTGRDCIVHRFKVRLRRGRRLVCLTQDAVLIPRHFGIVP